MTTGIPIPVHVVGTETSVAMLMRIASALEGMGKGASDSAPKVEELGSTLEELGEKANSVNEVREALSSLVEALTQTATGIAELASEQQRLDANSTRLNLNFRQAAEGAGGFVSEMQTMQLATSLANRGINATQNELNALARVGMARAVDAGKNVEEVFDSIADSVVEGGEELEKFGGSLHRVSDSTHSASERMEALAQRGREVAAPMRTAADEAHRLEDEFARMRRTLAAGFAGEFQRLASLPDSMRNAADEGARFNRELTEAAQTAARAVFAVGNGLGVIFGGIGAALGAMIGGVSALAAGLDNVGQRIRAGAHGQAGIQSPGAAMRSAWNEWTAPDSFAMRSGQFMERSMDRLSAQDDDSRSGLRGQGAPTAPAADPNAFVFTAEETLGVQRAEQERRNRRGGASSGGATASDAELARIEAGIAMAERQSPSERAARHGTTYDAVDGIVLRTSDILRRLQAQRIALLRQQAEERRSGESGAERQRRVAGLRGRIDELSRQMDTDDRTRATADVRGFMQQQQANPARERYAEFSRGMGDRARESLERDRNNQTEATERERDRSPDAARADMEKERGNRREARALDQRRDNLRNFTDFMEEQYTRQVNIAREGSEMVVFALRAMGSAYAENLVAWADGSKTFEEAANAMLSTVLSSLAKEAAAKSAFNIAEGIFALATQRYADAALHFAAAAGYGILAYGAGYAASAVKQEAPKRDEGKGAASSMGRASPQSGASSRESGPTVINVAFNGPQFGTGGVVQAARQLVGVINAGAVQGGVQMNRLAIPQGVR